MDFVDFEVDDFVNFESLLDFVDFVDFVDLMYWDFVSLWNFTDSPTLVGRPYSGWFKPCDLIDDNVPLFVVKTFVDFVVWDYADITAGGYSLLVPLFVEALFVARGRRGGKGRWRRLL